MGSTGDINDLYSYRWYEGDDSTPGANENAAWGSCADSYVILHTVICYDSSVCNKATDSEVIKLQVSKDGGGYIDVVSGSGDVRPAASPDVSLSDGTTVTQKVTTNVPSLCAAGYAANGLEVEGSDLTSNAVTIADDSYAEWAWGLDLTNAATGSTYTFRFYNVTTNAACTLTQTPSLTIAAPPGVDLVIPASGGNDCEIYDLGPLTITETEIYTANAQESYSLIDDNDGNPVDLTQLHELAVDLESYHLVDDNDGNPITITQVTRTDLDVAEAYSLIDDNDGAPVTLVYISDLDVAEAYSLLDDNDGSPITITETVFYTANAVEAYSLLDDNDGAPLALTQTHELAVDEAYSLLDDNDGNPITLSVTGVTNLADLDAYHLLDDNDGNPITISESSTSVSLADLDADHDLIDDGPLALTVPLTVAEAYSEIIDDMPLALGQLHILDVAEAASEIIDTGPINVSANANLAGLDAYHEHYGDSFALTQEHSLAVNESAHLLASDNISLSGVATLTVAECSHDHAADNIALSLVYVLTVAEAYHEHFADNIEVTSLPRLEIAAGDHVHTADNLVLSGIHNLAIDDAYSYHVGDRITVVHLGESFGRVYKTSLVPIGYRCVVNLTPEWRA